MFLNIVYNLFITPLELVFEVIFSFANRVAANPAIAIIVLSLAMNFLVLPLYKRADAMQEKERDKVNSMANWVNHIKKTFKGDERYMMLTTYYRQQNYKPIYALRSSFSLILQIPFFIAAYHFLSNLSTLNGASFLFLKDLGSPDQLLTIGSISINVMPIIMTLINFASAYIYLKGFPLKDKIQTYGIGIIFLIILYNSPSGLVFYWTLNQIFSMLKNVFMKIVKSRKVLDIVFSAVGIILLVVLLISGKFNSPKRIIALVVLVFVCQIPLIVSLIKKIKKESTKEPEQTKYILFLLGTIFLTLLIGVLIPLSVISSSPLEFVTNSFTPSSIVIKNVSIAAGYFLVWFNVFYYLANPKGKTIFTYIIWALSGVAVLDYMFFGKNLGTISTYLIYDNNVTFSMKEKLLNTLCILVVVVGFCLLMKFAKKFVPYLYLVLIVGIMTISIVNISTISSTLKTAKGAEETDDTYDPIIHLSKTGQNVVVLMLDRAIGAYVPYIMQEKPELIEKFDGFTYYPNTMSFGLHTNIAAPALFGGYNFTPQKIEERSNETLVSKHNAALLTMPTIFADNDFNAMAIDLPYANYQGEIDTSIFDGMENITAHRTTGKYLTQDIIEKYSPNVAKLQERNFFMYSIFKSAPVLLQKLIYNDGQYRSAGGRFLVNETYLNNYVVLDSLTKLTDFSSEKNSFLLMNNETTHEPVLLKTPEYILTPDPIENVETRKYVIDGKEMKMDNEMQISHFQSNVAAFLMLGRWFDYLRENGVYDNTRIIIVSDHGRQLHQFDYMDFELLDVQGYNPLLLVKDFNSTGFATDNTFMTNADTISIATENIIENDNWTLKEKNQTLTTSQNVWITNNDGYTLNIGDGKWLTVHDNIFDINNWSVANP